MDQKFCIEALYDPWRNTEVLTSEAKLKWPQSGWTVDKVGSSSEEQAISIWLVAGCVGEAPTALLLNVFL